MVSISRKEVLTKMSFGERIAEEEEKQLAKYFVETEQWRQIFGGQVDVVYGPKGSGKSALFACFKKRMRNCLLTASCLPLAKTLVA